MNIKTLLLILSLAWLLPVGWAQPADFNKTMRSYLRTVPEKKTKLSDLGWLLPSSGYKIYTIKVDGMYGQFDEKAAFEALQNSYQTACTTALQSALNSEGETSVPHAPFSIQNFRSNGRYWQSNQLAKKDIAFDVTRITCRSIDDLAEASGDRIYFIKRMENTKPVSSMFSISILIPDPTGIETMRNWESKMAEQAQATEQAEQSFAAFARAQRAIGSNSASNPQFYGQPQEGNLSEFRKNLLVGDKTSWGIVLQVSGPIAQIQQCKADRLTTASQCTEYTNVWYKKVELFPASTQ